MPSVKKNIAAVIATCGSAAALTQSPAASYSASTCLYTVSGLGSFTNTLSYDWGTGGLTSGLFNGLSASTYTVANNNALYARRFDLTNVGFDPSFFTTTALTLTVPGAQSSGPISVAQITTSYSDILYGSVRTVAKVSSVPGTTHGFSFYANDTQEVDFAFITNDLTKVHLTNEQVNSTSPATSYTASAPSDASTAFHEYRVDWVAGYTNFYIDGVLQQTITGNVPSTAGFWLWNNWSNGNTWAGGPPTAANTLHIQSITAYWNRTSVTSLLSSAQKSVCSFV